MQQLLTKYLQKFKQLRVDRTHGIAPHKPILLLSVLQGFDSRSIVGERIYFTPELIASFKNNWNLLVKTNHDCRISYPFYHLKSERFWTLIPKLGFNNINEMGSIVKSFARLSTAVECAIIDDDLLQLMQDHGSNNLLQHFILNQYFPGNNLDLDNLLVGQKKLVDDIEDQILNEDPVEYKRHIENFIKQHDDENIFLRGCLFKREIPKIYNNTCCISGMKIDSINHVSMIDACHIIPFSESYNDTVTNGIALCPNLHRAFDRGLIAIDENYKVIVSNCFIEEPDSYSIIKLHGMQIRLPNKKEHYPLVENFSWHREKILKGNIVT